MAEDNRNTNPGAADQNGTTGDVRTFTQEEVDTIVSRRLSRAMKDVPSADEINAYRTWKNNQQSEADKMNNLISERDSSKAALAKALAEIDQLKQKSYVASKGFTGDEAEFISFKAAKMAEEDEKLTFEAAVDKLAEGKQKKATFDWSAQVGGGSSKKTANGLMNDLIRSAAK